VRVRRAKQRLRALKAKIRLTKRDKAQATLLSFQLNGLDHY
jgi:hypothetical protein